MNPVIIISLLCYVQNIKSSSNVMVKHLGCFPRLNSPINRDCYYICSVIGRTLQWEVNGQNIGGYEIGCNVCNIIRRRNSSHINNFTLTSALLSQKQHDDINVKFDSLMIVSLVTEQQLVVICHSDNSRNTSNEKILSTSIDSNAEEGVLLEYLLKNDSTHIFICGTQSWPQWDASGINVTFAGINNVIPSSNMNPTAFVLHKQPDDTFNTTTVIAMNNNSNIYMTCSFETHQAKITLKYMESTTEVTPSLNSQPSTNGKDKIIIFIQKNKLLYFLFCFR